MNKTLLLTTTAISMLAFGANAADFGVVTTISGSSIASEAAGATIGKVTINSSDIMSMLTPEQQLAINSGLTSTSLDAYTKTTDLEANYAKKTDLNGYATTTDLDAYVKDADLAAKVEAAGFIKSVDTSNLADKDLSNLSDAGKTVITDLVAAEGYMKNDASDPFVKQSDVDSALSNYTNTTDMNALLDQKQDVISDTNKLAANLVDFSAEQQAAIDSGITSTLVGQITKNQTDIATNAGDIADLKANKQDNLVIKAESGLALDNGVELSVLTDNQTIGKNASGLFLMDNSVGTAKLQSESVTADKIANGAVTSDKIDTGAVTLEKIASSAFDSAVTSGSSNLVTSGTVYTHVQENAENGTYTGAKVNVQSGTNTISGAIAEVDAALGKVSEMTVNGYDATATGANMASAVSQLNTNMGNVLGSVYAADGSYAALSGNGFDTGANLAAQLEGYAANVAGAMGTTWSGSTFTNDFAGAGKTAGTDIASTDTLVGAIAQVNANLTNVLTSGLDEVDSAKVDVQWNSTDNTLAGVLGDGAYTNGYNVTAGDSLTAAIDALDGAIGNRNISSANTNINTEKAKSLAEGLAAAGNAIGSQTYANDATVKYDVIADGTDLTTAVSQVASNIGAAISSVESRTTGAMAVDNTVNANLAALDQAIGGDVQELYNGFDVNNSVNANLDALNSTVGDIANINPTYNNLSDTAGTSPATVADALYTLDSRLGTIHGLVADQTATTTTTGDAYYGNLAEGTTVQNHLSALDASIGDRRNMASSNAEVNEASKESLAKGLEAAANAIGDAKFDGTQYASTVDNISSAVRSLDNNLYRLENEVRDLRKGFNRGMASMAAMSALVPNARASGNTQLSLGTGMYSGHAGFALGGFHWITNNLLVNAGVAYGKGDSSDVVYRAGVTYSW